MKKPNTSKLRLLILGGEGFIGRNVALALSKSFECFSVGLRPSIFGTRYHDKFLCLDPYREEVPGRYDVIIQLIDPMGGEAQAVEAEKVLMSHIQMERAKHIIFFSTSAIYADPHSEYSRRKMRLEEVYRDSCRRWDIPLSIFRTFNAYGPYQLPKRKGSLISTLFFNYLNNGKTMINDTGVKRDFMYAPDIAAFILCALERQFDGMTDIGTEKMTSIGELLHLIEAEIVKDSLNAIEAPLAKSPSCPPPKNILLKGIPLTPLGKGLEKTYQFHRDHLEKIRETL